MNDLLKHYKKYERIMKMDPEQSIFKNFDFQSFSELYPYIAESIRLERKINRLTNLLKSEKHKGAKFKIKREIIATKSELKKNNLHKRLHGENKHEAIFRRRFKRSRSKIRNSLRIKNFRITFGRPIREAQKKIGAFMYNNLPPSLFNLRELTIEEKGLALKEWLKEKRTKLR